MHANISFLQKSFHLAPIIPVYFIILTVIYSFTKYFLLDYFNISQSENRGNNNSSNSTPNSYTNSSFILAVFMFFIKTTAIMVFYICAIMTIVCHLFSMFSNPGENPYLQKGIKLEMANKDVYCKSCSVSRPERSHHCKICQKCILRMDHHCPWVANCVGLKNTKFFFLFLFYATLGDFIAFLSLLTKVLYLDIDAKISENAKTSQSWDLLLAMKDSLICIFGLILAFFMTISIGFLFAIQLFNILKNKTTIEDKIFSDKESPYKYHTNHENFISVMGKNPYLWLIPVYHEDERYNIKKERSQENYLTLTDMEDPNINLNLQEI